MIRQTGGLAMGATSTRSRSSVRAIVSASGSGFMPSCWPSGSTSRTSRARMRSLIRCSLVAAVTIRHHSYARARGASTNLLTERCYEMADQCQRTDLTHQGWPGGDGQEAAPLPGSLGYQHEHHLDTRWGTTG